MTREPRRILLLGGAAETARLSQLLLDAGYSVLVSTATEEPLVLPAHPRLERRAGRLDTAAMAEWIRLENAAALVDATHPYAVAARNAAREAATAAGVPLFRYERPAAGTGTERGAPDHETAAALAFSFGRPVLLTIGSRFLAPYAKRMRETGLPAHARVLPGEESLRACRETGFPEAQVIAARGPFSLEENLRTIRERGIGVLVTKDGGEAGGFAAKAQAARESGCEFVVVERPPAAAGGFASPEALLAELRTRLP